MPVVDRSADELARGLVFTGRAVRPTTAASMHQPAPTGSGGMTPVVPPLARGGGIARFTPNTALRALLSSDRQPSQPQPPGQTGDRRPRGVVGRVPVDVAGDRDAAVPEQIRHRLDPPATNALVRVLGGARQFLRQFAQYSRVFATVRRWPKPVVAWENRTLANMCLLPSSE